MPCYISGPFTYEYRMVDVDKAVRKSAGGRAGNITVHIGGDRRESLRLHASGLKTGRCFDADRFQRRRSCNGKLCPLTQQRAQCCSTKYYGVIKNLTNTSEKQPFTLRLASVPVAAEHPQITKVATAQAGHRRRWHGIALRQFKDSGIPARGRCASSSNRLAATLSPRASRSLQASIRPSPSSGSRSPVGNYHSLRL